MSKILKLIMKESIDSSINIENSIEKEVEPGYKVIFGKLSDGNYFVKDSDGINIYDTDVYKIFFKNKTQDKTSDEIWDELDNKHLIKSYDNSSDVYKSLFDKKESVVLRNAGAELTDETPDVINENSSNINDLIQKVQTIPDKYEPKAIYTILYDEIENSSLDNDTKSHFRNIVSDSEEEGYSGEGACDNLLYELSKVAEDLTEDSYITINDGQAEDPDYLIQDVTELQDLNDEDIESPSIDGLLSLVNESLSNRYGNTWGYIKAQSMAKKESLQYAIIDIVTPSILKEAKEAKIKDTAVSKTVILENVPNSNLVNLKINTLAGTTRFSQKTNNPAKVLSRWLESEYLYEEMVEDFQKRVEARQQSLKDSTEAYLKEHPELVTRINTIKAQAEIMKQAKMLETGLPQLQEMIYGLAAEFPANISVKANKDNEDVEQKFDTIDELVKILFGKEYVKEECKCVKKVAEDNKKVVKKAQKESSLKENISTLKKGDKFSNGKVTVEIISVDNEHKLRNQPQVTYTFNGKDAKCYPMDSVVSMLNQNSYKPLNESSLKEAYQAFTIGEIEGMFNTETGEAMYSIPSKNIKDKKISLDKVPSTDTPYDTDTIIKDYVEKNFGVVQSEEEPQPEEEPIEPAPENTTNEPEETNADVEVDLDDEETLNEDAQSETGTASFYKVRQREPMDINNLIEKANSGANAQESEFIVVKEQELSEDEMNDFLSDLSKPQPFLQDVEPIDRKNYAFNVVKVTSSSSPYTLYVDPVGYSYPRYISLSQK